MPKKKTKVRKRVYIRAGHIQRGMAANSGSCPVALALRDAGFRGALVDSVTVCWGRGLKKEAAIPTRIGDFITAVDAGRPVKPTSFTVEYDE